MKILGPCIAAVAMPLSASGAQADPLVTFTDNYPDGGVRAFVTDSNVNWAVQWTQASATSNVTLQALLMTESGTPAYGNWYVTNAIGSGTTAANIIASGSYTASLQNDDVSNFNNVPRTILGTGLNFAAGTYYLVFDGLGSVPTFWGGDLPQFAGVALAPGFSVGSYYLTQSPTAFAPAGPFNSYGGAAFVFEMDSAAVPEPASWAMLIVGFGAIGVGMRRRTNKATTIVAFS